MGFYGDGSARAAKSRIKTFYSKVLELIVRASQSNSRKQENRDYLTDVTEQEEVRSLVTKFVTNSPNC